MIRTMIQLDEKQHTKLKKIAAERKVSIAELVREGVEKVIESEGTGGEEERKRKAIAAVGQFHSGITDTSEKHDKYLGEIYGRKSR